MWSDNHLKISLRSVDGVIVVEEYCRLLMLPWHYILEAISFDQSAGMKEVKVPNEDAKIAFVLIVAWRKERIAATTGQ